VSQVDEMEMNQSRDLIAQPTYLEESPRDYEEAASASHHPPATPVPMRRMPPCASAREGSGGRRPAAGRTCRQPYDITDDDHPLAASTRIRLSHATFQQPTIPSVPAAPHGPHTGPGPVLKNSPAGRKRMRGKSFFFFTNSTYVTD